MNSVYVNLYPTAHAALSLPAKLRAKGVEIEYLKGAAPDDGEADTQQSKYRIDCPEQETGALIRWLGESGQSLMYWVVKPVGADAMQVLDAGEFNWVDVNHAIRLFDSRHLLQFWFEDYLDTRLAA